MCTNKSFNLSIAAAAPPLNVQATQDSASAPVEVSWSPPSGGAATITGYRIFYGNGENVSVPSIVTGIILSLSGNLIGQTVSIHSEVDQLISELITVTITGEQYRSHAPQWMNVHINPPSSPRRQTESRCGQAFLLYWSWYYSWCDHSARVSGCYGDHSHHGNMLVEVRLSTESI